VSEGFETRAQTEGFRESLSSILIAIVAVYIVMVFTFRSSYILSPSCSVYP